MRITLLGQCGLLIETGAHLIMTDPYLTDSIFERGIEKYRRNILPEEKYLGLHPDMILITHDHSDHLDIASLRPLLSGNKPTDVLCGANAWKKVRSEIGENNNYIRMVPKTEWSTEYAHVRAVPAFHSDETGVGFVIEAEGKTVYLTGDTLYSKMIGSSVRQRVDVMFTVMNGAGNNMNYIDAAVLTAEIKPEIAVPVHWGLFASETADPELYAAECRKCGICTEIYRIYDTFIL